MRDVDVPALPGARAVGQPARSQELHAARPGAVGRQGDARWHWSDAAAYTARQPAMRCRVGAASRHEDRALNH
jgi:hypothetical protein